MNEQNTQKYAKNSEQTPKTEWKRFLYIYIMNVYKALTDVRDLEISIKDIALYINVYIFFSLVLCFISFTFVNISIHGYWIEMVFFAIWMNVDVVVLAVAAASRRLIKSVAFLNEP